MNGMSRASHMKNSFNMKECKKGRRRSDNKTGKCEGWKVIPKKVVEGLKGKRNGRTVTKKLT
jgi:hypothetical protein